MKSFFGHGFRNRETREQDEERKEQKKSSFNSEFPELNYLRGEGEEEERKRRGKRSEEEMKRRWGGPGPKINLGGSLFL